MKNKELYDKTVGILVDAYFKDTLMSGECPACAVGNLVAANCGYEIVKVNDSVGWFNQKNKYVSTLWDNVVVSYGVNGWPFKSKQTVNLELFTGEARRQIESTGYTLQQFAIIENSFEIGCSKWYKKDRMFSGLMSVIDCLDKIHENKDETVTTQTKNRFQKQLS